MTSGNGGKRERTTRQIADDKAKKAEAARKRKAKALRASK